MRLYWKLRQLKSDLIRKWPWMSKKRHTSEISILKRDNQMHLEREASRINGVLENLYRLRFAAEHSPRLGQRFTVEVAIADELLFGMRDFRDVIPYMADAIAAKVRHELKQVDFARFKPEEPIVRAAEKYRNRFVCEV